MLDELRLVTLAPNVTFLQDAEGVRAVEVLRF